MNVVGLPNSLRAMWRDLLGDSFILVSVHTWAFVVVSDALFVILDLHRFSRRDVWMFVISYRLRRSWDLGSNSGWWWACGLVNCRRSFVVMLGK